MLNKTKSFIFEKYEYNATFIDNKRSKYKKRFVGNHDKGEWEEITEKDYNQNLRLKSLLN